MTTQMGAPAELWLAYKATPTRELRNQLIMAEWYLVEVAVKQRRRGVRIPATISRDEVWTWAEDGLLKSVERYDPTLGFSFRTFALPGIIGAIVDGMRSRGWTPGRRIGKVSQVQEEMEIELGRSPTNKELAARLGRRKVPAVQWAGTLNEDIVDEKVLHDGTFDRARRLIVDWVSHLPPTEAHVMTLYYLGDPPGEGEPQRLTTEEIARRLNKSKAYVSGLRQSALARFDLQIRR